MRSYGVIAVGTDGSESSFLAVDRASALCADHGATLVIVCAYRREPREVVSDAQAGMGDDAFLVVGSQPATQRLERAALRAAATGASDIQTACVEGDAVDVLDSVAKYWNADLVAVGDRGLNTLAGRLLGSVPSGVLHKSAADVLIVHTTE